MAEAEDRGAEEQEGGSDATARPAGEGSCGRIHQHVKREPEARTPNTKKAPVA